MHQGGRRRLGYRAETIGGALDPSRFPELYAQGVTPEGFLAMREQVSGLSFIGTPYEVIPAKVICSIKAPKGRRKVRCVCCGNFARSDRWSRVDTHSGGIDAVTLKTLLRFAGLRRFDLGIMDVKQAFLSAPLFSNGVQIPCIL